MHKIQTKIIPIVVGAFGMIPKRLPEYLKELGIPDVVGGLQKTTNVYIFLQKVATFH